MKCQCQRCRSPLPPDLEMALAGDSHGFDVDDETAAGGAEDQFIGTLVEKAKTIVDQVTGCRIEDRTALTPKSKRIRTRDPSTVYALVLHQMAFSRGNEPKKYDSVTAHYAILPDGKILQLHPVSAYLYASNGFNARSVAVEFAGNLPSTRGRCWQSQKFGCHNLTDAQIQAGRCLVRHLIKTIGLTHVLAHRQASGTRENCPGPDIWYHVGQWAVDNLGLRDGGPGFKIDSGNAIPDAWRTWGKAKSGEIPGLRPDVLIPELEAIIGSEPYAGNGGIEGEFPALLKRNISASVGQGGVNRDDDVRAVQLLLNTFILAGRLPGFGMLGIDGMVGPNVISAIRAFQSAFVGMTNPDGRVDPGGRTLEKLNGSVFQSSNLSAPSSPMPPAAAPPTSVSAPARLGMREVQTLASAAGLPDVYQKFLLLCAQGESSGNNLTGLGIPDRFPAWSTFRQAWVANGSPSPTNLQKREASAAVKGYQRNTWLHNCWPETVYTFGSGGWFALLPSSGLAVFRGTPLACQHPWSLFDGPCSIVMAMGMIRRLQTWSQYKANPIVAALRVGWGAPGKMNSAQWIDARRERYMKHLRQLGDKGFPISASFLDERLPPLPTFDAVSLVKRLGGVIWLPG